jgi:hypothetical protein
MNSDKKIQHLEAEIKHLKEKEIKLERDLNLYKQIFSHLKTQFDHMKQNLIHK